MVHPLHKKIVYKQIRQLNISNIKKCRNLLARADYSSVLSNTDANETYDNFMLIYK